MNISIGAGIVLAAACGLIGFLFHLNVDKETIQYIAGGICTVAVVTILFG